MISAACLQVYLCLLACVGHIHWNGLVSVFRVRGVPKTSSPNDDVIPEVYAYSEGFPAIYLMTDSKPLESEGYRMGGRLVLVHLRASSGTDTCVSGAHIGCIAAGAPHCHMLLNRHETPSIAHTMNFVTGMTCSESVGRPRRHEVVPAP